MSVELKIKSKHLALEAAVIRHEERKLLRQIKYQRNRQLETQKLENTFNSICNHRKWDVRNENRATFLARAYIKGLPYKAAEAKVKDPHVRAAYIVPRVVAMLKKYHNYNISSEDVYNWITSGCSPG